MDMPNASPQNPDYYQSTPKKEKEPQVPEQTPPSKESEDANAAQPDIIPNFN